MILDKRQLFRLTQSKKVVAFGAGVTAEKTLHVVQDAFDYFVDNNEELWGTTFEDRLVFSPEKLREEDPNDLFIVICSTFYEELIVQLEGMGFQPGRNIGFSPLLHTVVAYRTLDTGSTRLLVSGYGGHGGLYLVNTRDGSHECVHEGPFRGVKLLDNELFAVVEREGIWVLDPESLEVKQKHSYPDFRNALGIEYCPDRNRFYVALSGRDEILVIDRETMNEIDRITLFAEKFQATGKEQHHINDMLVMHDGRKLLVSMFSLTGYWRQNVYDGCLVELDLDRMELGHTLMSGMAKPHTVRLFEDDIYLVDSFRGQVMRGSDNVIAEFNGFVRGLERDSERYYIGLSRNRHIEESYRLDKAIMANPGLMVYLHEDNVYKFIELPVSDVYAILDLGRDGE
ncbi:TIGR03032 family protein [bacterium]|nr:TIGR03032 family protein [bacterium]